MKPINCTMSNNNLKSNAISSSEQINCFFKREMHTLESSYYTFLMSFDNVLIFDEVEEEAPLSLYLLGDIALGFKKVARLSTE